MFEIKEADVATLLGVSPTTLSKVKNGGQNASNKFVPTAIYRKIFDPATSSSPAYGKKTESLLSDLKMIIETSFPTVQESLADCWKTEDYQKFVKELLSQTRRSLRPPKPDNSEPITKPSNTKTQSEQLQESFLMTAREYKVMEIINRQPPDLYRVDSASLSLFCDQIRDLVPYNSPPNSLEKLIEIFHDNLLRQTLVLDAMLNNQFGFDNESVSVNMEETDANSEEYRRKMLGFDVYSLTDKVLGEAERPLELLKITDTEWGKFRYEMNYLFEKIRSWSDKTAEK